jgi:hypothetical protein
MKFMSLKEILFTAKSKEETKLLVSSVQTKVLCAIEENRDLIDCANWLRGAIELIDEKIIEGQETGEIIDSIEYLRHIYVNDLLRVKKLLLADHSKN